MTRHSSFSFTLRPTAAQEKMLWRHAGASRFAYNQSLALVNEALAAKKAGADVRVPWSGFDLINAFNRWKRSAEAGVQENGAVGLAWRSEVTQQVFEEAAIDLGRGFTAYSARRTAGSRAAGFPKFKTRHDAHQSFRIRNRARGSSSSIRVGGEGRERSIELPRLGLLVVRECTRRVRRMLKKGRLKILFATISHRTGGRWKVTINVEAAALHPALCHPAEGARVAVGIDRGLRTFAVLADAKLREIERIEAPRPLRRELPKLRKLSRSVSRKKKGSKNRRKARHRLSKLHHRIGNVRRDFVHRISSRLAKTHGHLVLETLNTAGMMRTRLARSLADSAWAMFARTLQYQQEWRGGTLLFANRFYPSTRRCSACAMVGNALPLSERRFHCRSCGHEADRDTNAAVCLAQYPASSSHVAAKQAETKNACREESADAWVRPTRETSLDEAGRAFAQRPRRAVSAGSPADTLYLKCGAGGRGWRAPPRP